MRNESGEALNPIHSSPPRRVIVIIVVAVGILVAASLYGEFASTPPMSGWMIGLDIAVAVLGLAALPLLYRRPKLIALAYAAAALVSPATVPLSSVATIEVARVRRPRPALLLAGVVAVGHLLRGLWRPMGELPYGWYAILVLAVQVANFAWGARQGSQQALLGSLHERARQAEADQQRLVVEARLTERTRIAREMHDGLAHRLSLLATYSGALEFRPDASPEKVSRAAGVIREGVHQTLDELREVITLLRDDSDDPFSARRPLPGLGDLDQLVEESRSAGTQIELSHDLNEGTDAPTPVSRTAYRVVQEGLTNARRHAPGKPVSLKITELEGPVLEVIISNPLPAEPVVSPGSGTGLIGLEERVHLAGGELRHGRDATTFTLTARIPWPDGETRARSHR